MHLSLYRWKRVFANWWSSFPTWGPFLSGTRKRRKGEEDPEGTYGLYRSPAEHSGAELRSSEVPQRPGSHGTGRQTQPQRHPSQDLVSE